MADEREQRADQSDGSDEQELLEPLEQGEPGSNLITPAGMKRLKDDIHKISTVDKPPVLETISKLVNQGDHLNNAEYLDAKKKLRELDRKLRFLGRRIELATVIDPASQPAGVVAFGAKVTTKNENGQKKTYHIVGEDEIDIAHGKISWKSPVAKGLMDAQIDDWVTIELPNGAVDLCVVNISYEP